MVRLSVAVEEEPETPEVEGRTTRMRGLVEEADNRGTTTIKEAVEGEEGADLDGKITTSLNATGTLRLPSSLSGRCWRRSISLDCRN